MRKDKSLKGAPMPEILRLPIMYMNRSQKRMDEAKHALDAARNTDEGMTAGFKYTYYHGVFECAKAMFEVLTLKEPETGMAGILWREIVKNE